MCILRGFNGNLRLPACVLERGQHLRTRRLCRSAFDCGAAPWISMETRQVYGDWTGLLSIPFTSFFSTSAGSPKMVLNTCCPLTLSLSLQKKLYIYIYISIYIHTEKEGTKASCRQRIVSFSGGRLSIYLAGVYRHIGCGLSICSRTLGESCR